MPIPTKNMTLFENSSGTWWTSFLVGLITLLASNAFSVADNVLLLNGKTIEGKITFDAKDGLVILPKNQPSQRVEIKDLLALTIDTNKTTAPKRLVMLVNGSQIAADDVLAVTDNEVRVKRTDGSLLNFSPLLLQSIVYRPSPDAQSPPKTFVGVRTVSGDLAEGEILGLDSRSVRVSSVLFGIQEFDLGNAVNAIYFRSEGMSRAAYVVRTSDGSIWQAASISIDRGKLQIDGDVLGKIDLPGDSIQSITLGAASAEPLPGDATITLAPGESTQIKLDGKYRSVLLSLSVPARFVPNRPVRFIVNADGKELTKTAAITAIDAAIPLTVSVEGVKSLTIRMEADGPSQLGVAGHIADARLIRR